MSQRSAAWNLAVELIPLVLGSAIFLMRLTVRQARLAPLELFVSICSAYGVGLLLLCGAKLTVFRKGTFSAVAPCQPGAALRDVCNTSRFQGTGGF